jgi:hypothetical protein
MDTVCKFRVAASHQLTTPTKHLVIIKFHQLLFSYKEQDKQNKWTEIKSKPTLYIRFNDKYLLIIKKAGTRPKFNSQGRI